VEQSKYQEKGMTQWKYQLPQYPLISKQHIESHQRIQVVMTCKFKQQDVNGTRWTLEMSWQYP